MPARAETSTNLQNSEREPGGSSGMSVAVIGPNDAHRKIVANALSSEDGRSVHEFNDYPGQLSDLPHVLGRNFDVVLVDVDTDQSYALQIIEKLAKLGSAVMAYSARNDEELLTSCMHAGARDFLPLPSENDSAPSPAPDSAPKPVAAASQSVPRPSESRIPPNGDATVVPRPPEPKPGVVSVAPRASVTPVAPERRIEILEQRSAWVTNEPIEPVEQIGDSAAVDVLQNSAKPFTHIEEDAVPLDIAKEPAKAENASSEFAEWDAAHLRRAPAPPVKRPEPRLRPSLVPERKKPDGPPRVVPSVVPSVDPPPAPVAERPPVSVEIFRASQMNREFSEEAERQGTNWIKWILIAAGPVVLALVLLIAFTHSSTQSTASTSPRPAPTSDETPAPSDGQLIVDATGKPTNTPQASKPSPAQVADTTSRPETSNPAPVAPDAMAQQLVAPERIAGNLRKTAADAPPPAAPNAVALEDNAAIPGSVFGSSSKPKFVPRVMPISAGVADGMIIRKTQPVYPKFAQDAHITGKVVLKATITKQGSIEGVQVLSGPKILAPAAVDAVKTWKYRPYTLDGQPVAVETTVTIVFGNAR